MDGAVMCAMRVASLLAYVIVASIQPASAADQPGIASINACTDQLLLAFADAAQIRGLSPFARDPVYSSDPDRAGQFPQLSGYAEDVLLLKPDLVVAGSFTKPATRELLKAKGLRVAEFGVATSIDDAKAQMRAMAALTGHPDRAEAAIAALDAAVATARTTIGTRSLRVLPLSRRGWASGRDSVTGSLLAAVGLGNAADELGLAGGGFATLEAIVAARPDLLLISDASGLAQDEGSAFLLHPALERLYPPSKRIVVPDRLTECGGPLLVTAMQRLAAEVVRVMR